MIRCSILEKYSNRIVGILYKEVKDRLEAFFEAEFMTSDLQESDLEISDICHLFPGSYARYKSKKEILEVLLEVKDILTDDIVRKQLKPLYVYILYMLDSRFFELQKEWIDSGEMQEDELISDGVKELLATSTELSQEDKDSIEFWFTSTMWDDIYNYYDEWNLDDYITMGWNDFAAIAQSFLKTSEISEECLEMLEDGMCFVPKDIADLCINKINTGKYKLIKNHISKHDHDKTDFFISYASEEKVIALELSNQLEKLGASTWIDERNIKIGDSIKSSIETGILSAEYAIVILSENYLRKYWTNSEINSLFELEENGHKKILPLTFNLSHEELKGKSVLLANRLCLPITNDNIQSVAERLLKDTLLHTNDSHK